MERRRWRPGATVSSGERWNPSLMLVIVAVGLILGLGIGLRDRIFGGAVDIEERYLVLASALYAQDPSTAPVLHDRLVDFGYSNPPLIVSRLSERYANSDNHQERRQADELRALGDAFLMGYAPPGLPAETAATRVASPTVVDRTETTVSDPTPDPEPEPEPVPTSTPTPEPVLSSHGVIMSAGREAVNLRQEPNTQSGIIAVMQYGAGVDILDLVEGDANDPGIDPTEIRWYRISYRADTGEVWTGYVYHKLLVQQ